MNLKLLRNIGISAHIDSGKTTLSERILYYAGRINKMDRTGANEVSVVRQLKEKLGCDAVLMQIPVGREEKFEGVIDLVTMKALYFDGANGEKVREEAIPAAQQSEAEKARHHMLEALSMYSDK